MSRREEFDKATVFDWHGTLADSSGKPRQKMLKKAEKADKRGDVIILTASSDKKGAEEWLDKHDVDYDKLVARPKGAKGSDPKIKEKLLEKDIEPEYQVTKAYDDEKKNVKMFKKKGIKAKDV